MNALRGVIIFFREDAQEVRSLGVELLSLKVAGKTEETEEWECRVSEEAFKKLDPLWGRFIWALFPENEEPKKEETHVQGEFRGRHSRRG